MPALKPTSMQAENPATPTQPVTHRAILKPRGPAEEIRRAILTPLEQLCAGAKQAPSKPETKSNG